jgi:hypothetical protein
MNIDTLLLAARDFIKSTDGMPNGLKWFLLVSLLAAATWCYTIDKVPAILHEAPPVIRALREQPTEPLAKIQADSAEGHRN